MCGGGVGGRGFEGGLSGADIGEGEVVFEGGCGRDGCKCGGGLVEGDDVIKAIGVELGLFDDGDGLGDFVGENDGLGVIDGDGDGVEFALDCGGFFRQ